MPQLETLKPPSIYLLRLFLWTLEFMSSVKKLQRLESIPHSPALFCVFSWIIDAGSPPLVAYASLCLLCLSDHLSEPSQYREWGRARRGLPCLPAPQSSVHITQLGLRNISETIEDTGHRKSLPIPPSLFSNES